MNFLAKNCDILYYGDWNGFASLLSRGLSILTMITICNENIYALIPARSPMGKHFSFF